MTHSGEAFCAHVDAPKASESKLEKKQRWERFVRVGERERVRKGGGTEKGNIRAFTSVRGRRTKS